MGLRGPTKKPSLKLAGTPKDGRTPGAQEAPEPPDHLCELAKDYWRETMPRLLEIERWEPMYTGPFSMLCMCYADMLSIQKEIEDKGLTEPGHRGAKKHPLWQCLNDARNHYHKFMREFGLSPLTINRAESAKKPHAPESKLSQLGINQ